MICSYIILRAICDRVYRGHTQGYMICNYIVLRAICEYNIKLDQELMNGGSPQRTHLKVSYLTRITLEPKAPKECLLTSLSPNLKGLGFRV